MAEGAKARGLGEDRPLETVSRGVARRGWRHWFFVALLAAPLASAASLQAQNLTIRVADAGAPAADLADLHVEELLTILRDGKADPAQRRQGARLLLQRASNDSIRALGRELEAEPGDVDTQQIIAQAMLDDPQDPPAVLLEPMQRLLYRVEEGRLGDVAAALARFADTRLERALVKQALDGQAAQAARLRAVVALGHFRSQVAADALLELTAPQQPPPIAAAAYSALAQLSGRADFGADRARWLAWWQQNKDAPRTRWLLSLIDNIARRNRELARQTEQSEQRFLDSQRQLYRVTPEENRSALLQAMLADASPSLRLLGMELADQRFITDAKVPTPESVAALLARLDDALPEMRRRAARLLRELKDETAADTVAGRLIEAREQDREVVRAYLGMMSRLPRAGVCARAIELLNDAELHADAAAVLVAAADAGLLQEQQMQQIAAWLRQQIVEDRLAEPQFVALLGRVGDEQDWRRILKWLDSGDAAVKRAAAEAWAASQRPLMPLAERGNDPIIQPIAINAAMRRGKEGGTLLALIQHRPRQEQVAQAWQRALVALAGRVPVSAVLQADQMLLQREEPPSLRDQLLSAAIDRIEPKHAAGDLLLARAEVRLALGDVNQALADLTLLENHEPALTPTQSQRRWMLLLRARLAGGDVDAAFEVAQRLVQQARSADGERWHHRIDEIVAHFLAAAKRALATNQLALATRIVDRLEQLTSPGAPDTMKQRLAEVRQQISTVTPPPPTTPGASPAPTAPSNPSAPGGAAGEPARANPAAPPTAATATPHVVEPSK